MSTFPELKKEDVNAILDWVDAQPLPGEGGGPTPDGVAAVEEEDSSVWLWVGLGSFSL